MKYLAKKLAGFVMTMLVVSFLVFAAFAVIPGDPATAMLGTQATPEKLAALREQMGLNEPLLVRFGSWAVNFIQGDFGTSYKYQMSVRSMIAEKIPVTLTLTAMSFLIMVAVSIPVGLFCAHHAGGKVDRIVLIVNQVIMAIPPFFSGILITLLFGLVLHLFTPGGYVSYTTSVTGFLGYLIFPSVAIALPKAAMAIKLLRTSVLSEMKLDYVRTAYSRGNNTKGVLYQHVLRNAIIPVITFLGMALADMVAGSIVIEQVFNIPGLGRILLTSISNRDYPVVQGNQQSMHFAFLFNWAKKPWLTQKWSRSIIDKYYGTGIANAYLGDEDQGQMSSWFVMAALGLFQTDGGCRIDPIYEIASPLYEKVIIDLGERYNRGKTFTIEAKNVSRKNKYVQSAMLNGKVLNEFFFPASELLKGGELILEMGDKPNTSWGIPTCN